MLRLVHPAPEGQGTDPPKRRRGPAPALSITPEERRHLRTAVKNTARAYGGMAVLVTATGLPLNTLRSIAYGQGTGSVALARVIAKVAGVSIEAVLSGTLSAAGRCSTCGHRVGDGRLAAAGGGQ